MPISRSRGGHGVFKGRARIRAGCERVSEVDRSVSKLNQRFVCRCRSGWELERFRCGGAAEVRDAAKSVVCLSCNQTVMSGSMLIGSIDFARFLFSLVPVCRALFTSFLVRNWCGSLDAVPDRILVCGGSIPAVGVRQSCCSRRFTVGHHRHANPGLSCVRLRLHAPAHNTPKGGIAEDIRPFPTSSCLRRLLVEIGSITTAARRAQSASTDKILRVLLSVAAESID